jgi:PilZ domain
MSQTYFSKQDPKETQSRLSSLATSQGSITVWMKGNKDKHNYTVFRYDKDKKELLLDARELPYNLGQSLLCTFDVRGMKFFSEVVLKESVGGFPVLQFKGIVYKSERRKSFRLLTYPLYHIWARLDLNLAFEDGKVIDIKTKFSQTHLFKSFLKIVDNLGSEDELDTSKLKIRVQDLSISGMALHVGELEGQFFESGRIFENVELIFDDEIVHIPKAKIVYKIDLITHEKNVTRYKLGVHFLDLPPGVEDQIGKKLTKLLREIDQNKDFENILK